MTYEVHLADPAASYLRKLDARTQQRILRRIDQIAAEPYGPHTIALTNAAGRRTARVGDYRIVFKVDDANRVVDVSLIGPRGRVYRDL